MKVESYRMIRCTAPGNTSIDLFSEHSKEIWLRPGEEAEFPTGYVVEIPPGYTATVHSCSDRPSGHVLAGLQASGRVIDSTYRGEIMVNLRNAGQYFIAIRPSQRIACLRISAIDFEAEDRRSVTSAYNE